MENSKNIPHQSAPNTAAVAIPKRLLLSVYLIVPTLVAIVLIDIFYFDATLRPYMGVEALLLPAFIFLFVLPHIIASFFSFFDNEYVSYYRRHLFLYLPLVLIGTALLLYFDYRLGIAFFLINDVWHGVKQKVGIGLILGARPNWLFHTWKLLPFVTTSIAILYYVSPSVIPFWFIQYISPVLFVGAILILATMVAMVIRSAASVKWYVFAVSGLFLASYLFILVEYLFFAILAFRFVHDVSAFAFYATHDQNRAKVGGKNWFYQLFKMVPASTLVMTVILGFGLAALVRYVAGGLAIGYSIVILIAMTHYYLEAIMWKRNSPHRQHVRVE
tara:strand:- start:319 stop:1311 length:993 start_codon:yes stop_codon:yes gene_type:complete